MSIPKSRFRKIDFYAKRPDVTVDELHSTLLEGAKVVAEIPLVKTNNAPLRNNKISESYDFQWWLTSNVFNPSPSRETIQAAARPGTLSQSWSSRAGRNVKR
jgi:hypothetical protein